MDTQHYIRQNESSIYKGTEGKIIKPLGVRSWLIACDESGIHDSTHYGFGSLWLKWQRRGDFINDFREMKKLHGMTRECKWTYARSMKYLDFYKELIDYFFYRQWVVFHCLVVRKNSVALADYHDNNWDLARRKHFTELLTNKMKRAIQKFPDREHEFRVYVDEIASKYKKADEVVEVISNHVLNKTFRTKSPVKAVITRDSANTPAIQLCDLLLGAVMESWQQRNTNRTRKAVRSCIADYLGWPRLDSDTYIHERKFNIWYFTDTTREPRSVKTRSVKLKYPYPNK